ncbi:sugar ABC transporter substrate-binding protein [Dactylosporangium sp. CS-033363]|uniref:sugar ABC transporter substrate-binding protein n=1 Tax=Dactylosporangium sp. CS-033363 TaxID=3239935 RepID=UPI003D90CB9E
MRPQRLLIGVVALLLAGCGGPGASGAQAPRPELTIWIDALRAPAIKQAADKFGQDSGVSVRTEIVAKDLQTQFVTAAQAGKGPDLVLGAHDWIGNLVQNGTIDPVQMTNRQKATFDPLALKGVTFNGQIYGVPFAVANVVLIRNTELAPQAPQTMEELVETGRQLVAAGRTQEIMALPMGPTGDFYHLYPLFTSAGGYMFGTKADGDYDPKDLGVAKPEATQAFQKIAALGEGGAGALKRSISNDNARGLFTDRKTAFLLSGPWQFADINKSGVKYDVSPIPPFAGGKPARPFVTVDAAYVASRGAHKLLAQEFVTSYFTRTEVAVALYRADPRPPALIAALDQVKGGDPNLEKVLKAGQQGEIMPAIPAMATVWDPLGKAEAAVTGGAAPGPTITAAAAAIQSQIK